MRRIVYSSPYVPAEWIAAHGLRPCRLVPGRNGTDTPVQSIAGVCPFMRAFVNDACASRNTAGLVLATVCDQMRRAKDHVEAFSRVPVFLLNVPSTWTTQAAQRLYRAELDRLGLFLVEQGGEAPSRTALCRAMIKGERQRAAQRRPGTARQTGIALALLGGPLVARDLEILEAVTAAGGHVVLDGTENGERVLPAPFHPRRMCRDPLGELVEAYFKSIPDIFQRPNTRLYEWLRREIRAHGARGVVLLRHVWCDKWHAEVQRLKESLAVPLLDVDVDGDSTQVRNRTRVEAFLEGLS